MRISANKVVQLVESNPPTLVILDERTGAEIPLIQSEIANLIEAIEYFGPFVLRNSNGG